MFDAHDIPRFGVPEKIPKRDMAFVVLAGLGLTVVFWGIIEMASEAVGAELSADNPAAVITLLTGLGLGPAIAYHLPRRLRASHVSLARGCASLVVWAVLLGVGGSIAGWLGATIVSAIGGLAFLRLRRPAGQVHDHASEAAAASVTTGRFERGAGPEPGRDLLGMVGDGVFYVCVPGAIGGMIVGGVIGLLSGNAGLSKVENSGGFLIATGLAAIIIGIVASMAWAAVVGALIRSPSAGAVRSVWIIALVSSASAAMIFMLVAQPLAGPIALWGFILSVLYCALAVAWGLIGSIRHGSRSGEGRR